MNKEQSPAQLPLAHFLPQTSLHPSFSPRVTPSLPLAQVSSSFLRFSTCSFSCEPRRPPGKLFLAKQTPLCSGREGRGACSCSPGGGSTKTELQGAQRPRASPHILGQAGSLGRAPRSLVKIFREVFLMRLSPQYFICQQQTQKRVALHPRNLG